MSTKHIEKTFVVSQLPNITLQELDGCDSVLISDKDKRTGKWYTKRVDVSTIIQYITKKDGSISSLVNNAINSSASSGTIHTEVTHTVDETLKNDITKYAPIQEWYDAGTEVDDDVFIIDGGDCGDMVQS